MQDSIANGTQRQPLNALQKFHLGVKIAASVACVSQGLYYATTQPGIMDSLNAVMGGLVILAIWFMQERKAKP